MQQVLFRIPLRIFDWLPNWLPDSVPIYGFGVMLFLSYILCGWLASWRGEKEGVGRERIHDLDLWLFVSGIIGARVTYMIQYHLSLAQFLVIWEGGLVFYGSFLGGFVGYGLWRAALEGKEVLLERKRTLVNWTISGALLAVAAIHFGPDILPAQMTGGERFGLAAVLGGLTGFAFAYILAIQKNAPLNGKILDIVAPALALGLALGRVGCLLNGCCYGNVACPHCVQISFPLSAPPRSTYVGLGYQTATGFTVTDQQDEDPRTKVGRVEPGSPAAESGLKAGDRIVGVNGKPNQILAEIDGTDGSGAWVALQDYLHANGRSTTALKPGRVRVAYDDFRTYDDDVRHFLGSKALHFFRMDLFSELIEPSKWPHGERYLQLDVQRAGQAEPVSLPPFAPRTLGLHPTQIYETISALLILFLLTAYFPFRRHYGEVMALFMLCYSIHRFINEMLRNDTAAVGDTGMTLSQNGSILVCVAALMIFLWVRVRPTQIPMPTPTPNPAT